jgi:uncharacterized repeat protein (TIGR01451 family)
MRAQAIFSAMPGALALTAALALTPLASPALAGPPAGSAIVNVAAGAATDSITGGTIAAQSNAVVAVVGPLETLTLTPGRSISVAPGGSVTFPHRLANVGNVTTDVRLDLADLAGDGFDFTSLSLVRDLDGDGIASATDAPLISGGTLTLAAGGTADLLVVANVSAGAPVPASAWARLTATGLTQGAVAAATDTALTAQLTIPPAIAFYRDPGYVSVTHVTGVDDPLYLEAYAPGCNLRSDVRDSVMITLRAQETRDVETFVAHETDLSTGRFRIDPRVPSRRGSAGFAASVPGMIEIAPNDQVTADLYGCGAPRTEAIVWVDPAGRVFDSRSDGSVAGARVALLDVFGTGNGGDAGGPARVFQNDGVTPAPAALVTGADGRYLFPFVASGTYRLVVVPPADHRFPSAVATVALPSGHVIDPAGSYGGDFTLTVPGSPVRIDLPADGLAVRALFVEKTASRTFAELGDEVDYTVRVANRSDSALAAVTLEDHLPTGFAFVPGSARRDTSRLADPAGARGPRLALQLGDLAANAVATVRYRVRIGAAAREGDGINRAVATGGSVTSNVASARVAITGGVFADEASVIGTVFVDRDRDRKHGAGELGIPGVRLYLDDGTFVVTDRDGQYSVYGLAPRTTALKLDATTLPEGATLEATTAAGDSRPGVRFLDLQRGDFRRTDFCVAVAPTDTITLKQIAARRTSGVSGDEFGGGFARQLTTQDQAGGDLRSRPATGIAGDATRLPLFDAAARREAAPATVAMPEGRHAGTVLAVPASFAPGNATDSLAMTQAMQDLERTLAGLDPSTGFVDLADDDTLAADQATVRVKGAAGAVLELRVDDMVVPESRVGRRVTLADRGVEAWEYVGVTLEPGLNRLAVVSRAPDGVERDRHVIHVVAPNKLSRLALDAPAGAPADGHSRAHVRIRALDEHGVPVAARTFVTLEATAGEWQSPDLDPLTPGLQVTVEGGTRELMLLAPSTPGTAILRATAGHAHAETELAFVPELRPLIMVGSAEGIVRLDDLRHGPAVTSVSRDGFEQGIHQFASERADGRASAAARAALFVKGRLRDDMLLTLGYDSDRPTGQRRLRDLQPDAYDPVYGDGSVRGYDAQSTGRLYARLDRRGASLLYGDFVTPGAGGARSLSAYSRSLTGVQEHFENHRFRLDAFTSRERTKRRVDELAARGISGPYLLTTSPIVENSEQVEILVRDRNQPGVVLRSEPKARFTDYELEALTGRLLFKAPVPSLDPDLNPVSVRVSYAVDGAGDAAWVSGTELRGRLGARIELGGSYVDDHDATDPYELRSLFGAARLGTTTTLEGEYAASRTPGGTSGDGGRVELRHEGAGVQARAYGAITDAGFTNPTAGFAPGREEAGAHLSARVAARSRVLFDALFSADASGGPRRGGLLVGLDQGLSPAVRGELGMRINAERRAGAPAAPAQFAARGKLSAQWPAHPAWSGYGEAEQDVQVAARRMLAVGGEVRVSTHGRLYARHELISSLSGPYALDAAQRRLATVFGVDADVAKDAHVFSEYRVADAIAGRDAEAAVGLRNGWRLGQGLRASTSFERVNVLRGSNAGPTMAVTGAIETTDDEQVKASTRIEVRTARTGASILTTAGLACRLDSVWTALGRNLLSLSTDASNGSQQRDRFQIGVAYRRPDRAAWDALGRYELHYDRDPTPGSASRLRLANVLSVRGTGDVFGFMTASIAWAGKVAVEHAADVRSSTQAQWLHGRWSRDIGRGWDAGVNTSVLFVDHTRSRRDGLGVEVGRSLANGLWVSGGWNRFGYADEDLPDEAYTRTGAYLRLRARFDEGLFTRARGAQP